MKGELPESWRDQPCQQGMLAVDAEHSVHWRTYGDRNLQAVLFLHGGPGTGVDLGSLCFFEPDKHFVVLFDQRGAGQSTPRGSISNNTTQHLISDINLLQTTLKLSRWIVFGGSWGATLGLLYAQTYPDSCTGLVLRGISNSYAYQNYWMLDKRPLLIPQRHEAFLMTLDPKQQADPVLAHYHNIISSDIERRLNALKAINVLESGMSEAIPEPVETGIELTDADLDSDLFARATIYLHYWANNKFLNDSQCLPNPVAIKGMDIQFIHGESDWICPVTGAQKILESLPQASLVTVPGAGHSPFHAGMTRALQQALARLQ